MEKKSYRASDEAVQSFDVVVEQTIATIALVEGEQYGISAVESAFMAVGKHVAEHVPNEAPSVYRFVIPGLPKLASEVFTLTVASKLELV